MKSEFKKAIGCGVAASSFLMFSAFSSIAPDPAVTNQSQFKSTIVSETDFNVDGMVEQIEKLQQEKIEAEKASPLYNKALANVKDSVNIRKKATTKSDVVGVLYKGGAADIVEKGEEWTKVVSGDVEGYIYNEYLAFGEEAEKLAEKEGVHVATVTADGLRLRKGPGIDEGVGGFANDGNKFEVKETTDEWVEVKVDDQSYYVASDYVEVEQTFEEAKSMEEIEAERIAAEKAAAEKAAAEKAAAEKAAAEKAAAKKAEKNSAGESGQGSSEESAPVNASGGDLGLLAAIIECEAGGESYEGKVAVGAVVMNRVRSGKFPNSINAVVYQSGQFGPASSGKLSKVLARGANSSCVKAAQAALNGSNNVGSALYFQSKSVGKGMVIGNHCFY